MDYNAEYPKIEAEILALKLPKPALRALINADIYTVKKLISMSITEIETLHGMGPTSVQKIKSLLADTQHERA